MQQTAVYMKIVDLCIDERPREKMLVKGARSLTNIELIAIILRTGNRNDNAVDLARKILKEIDNSLSGLSKMSIEKFCSIDGIGTGKALSLMAAMELGKRYYEDSPNIKKVSITDAGMIYKVMSPIMKHLGHEECWVIFLNRANYIIDKEMISRGGMNATVIDNRIIIKRALEKQASGIIIVHNHPSGNPHPGESDIEQTKLLKKALDTFDISLLDHIVIADDRYYSFADDSVTVEEP